MTTPYQSQYWGHALTLKGSSDSVANLARSIANARVDLNPHQVEAALFAIRSPFSKGVLLADEVGLGKTIEAGLVLSQRWAERHRKLLLILPATLRNQWARELEEKFYLPTQILEKRAYNQLRRSGTPNPFDQSDKVLLVSYQFAAQHRDEIRRVPWDLVVLDEAHRVRNVYKAGNKTAQALQHAVEHAPKILLTATPLQNSLLELYGLSSFIDPHIFGDVDSFKEKFVRSNDEVLRNLELRTRLAPHCTRTLRRQVAEYIRFTNRIPFTQEFYPSDNEQHLYDAVSAYLQRDVLHALPASQRKLMTLVLRKLLASSTFAIADTLRRLVYRLEHLAEEGVELFDPDVEAILDEEDDEGLFEDGEFAPEPDAATIKQLIAEELAELRTYATLAANIGHNAKGTALVLALREAFHQAEGLGAPRKAVVFTESRRTQRYLYELLIANGYAGQVVLLNGTNTDPECTAVYNRWLARHEGDTRVRESKQVAMRSALVEEFSDHATIMLATEAGAEGLNLQFCSLVVNYDLPWNPQRVEQRIGRCHRYGQTHDVVVVNFLNKRNEADQRVFQLLAEKFKLFDGVFGSSDEVLGALESGVDIERRILQVYQTCRTQAEITAAFDALQRQLEDEIQARMTQTRQALIDNFDEEVHARLKVNRDAAIHSLDQRTRWLAGLTRFELGGTAQWSPDAMSFVFMANGSGSASYFLDWKAAERAGGVHYRPESDLACELIQRAIDRALPVAEVLFDYDAYGAIVSALEPHRGRSGWLELTKVTVDSLQREEFLIFSARLDDGTVLDDELCHKLIGFPARIVRERVEEPAPDLAPIREAEVKARVEEVSQRNVRFFDEEVQKLDRWADDLRYGPERELKDIDREIADARRVANLAQTLQEKLDAQRAVQAFERKRTNKRREIFEAQDAIDGQRDELIGKLEGQLRQRVAQLAIFEVQWRLT
jgi:adenine-specific DNA-methyltransferase